MTTVEALQVLIDHRQNDQIVITNQASSREWPQLSDHALDFHFLPSAMGMAVPFALGLALARPAQEVIVITGDGSLLMNMGALVTVAGSRSANVSVVLLDNGVYAVTGGQKTAAADTRVHFPGIAKSSGFSSVFDFEQLSHWRDRCPDVLSSAGPRFVRLRVRPEHHPMAPEILLPIRERVSKFREALGASSAGS